MQRGSDSGEDVSGSVLVCSGGFFAKRRDSRKVGSPIAHQSTRAGKRTDGDKPAGRQELSPGLT